MGIGDEDHSGLLRGVCLRVGICYHLSLLQCVGREETGNGAGF